MTEPPERKGPSKLQFILFLLAGSLVFLGEQFNIPLAGDLAMVFFGLLIIVASGDSIIQELGIFRIDGWTQAKVVETYRGLADLLWEFVAIGFGLALMAISVLKWLRPDSSDSIWNELFSGTTGIGLILAGMGLMMLLNGLIRALAGSGTVSPQRLAGLPFLFDRLVGVATFVLGGAASAIGLLLLISPAVVTSAIKQLTSLIVGP